MAESRALNTAGSTEDPNPSFCPGRESLLTRLRRLATLFWQALGTNPAEPVSYDWFTEAELAGYEGSQSEERPERIDDATWSDLGVGALLRLLGRQGSIFALQMLYHRLRSGATADVECTPLRTMQDVGPLLAATATARQLLRSVSTDLTPLLFRQKDVQVPAWALRVWLLPCAEAAVLAWLWSQSLWGGMLAAVVASVVINGTIQIKLHAPLTRWRQQRRTLQALLDAALALASVHTRHALPVEATLLPESMATLRRLRRLVSPTWLEKIPGASEYTDLVALDAYGKLARNIASVRGEIASFQEVYRFVAECEMNLCLAEHLAENPKVCWAQRSSGRQIMLRDAANPLLAKSLPLSIELLDKGAFITGRNGVGKSTFLRTVGLNILLARAFGFCHAIEAMVPFWAVFSSIRNEDSLEQSRSLYMAEMARAEALLRRAEQMNETVFIVDEMFRATNNIEAVAVGAAVMDHLAHSGMVLASSHNLVLAPLLEHRLVSLRVVRNQQDGSLSLEPGVLAHTNGIEMMSDYDVPPSVVTTARAVCDWYSAYVTTPDHYPNLHLP